MESGPKTSAQLFSDILKLQNEGSLPPVDDWNPPLCENVQTVSYTHLTLPTMDSV